LVYHGPALELQMTDLLKLEDTVQLKSGGPEMTVETLCPDYNPPSVYCSWFDNTKRKLGSAIPVSNLKKIK
jgi:uncharacterized protein YodC (DUF2158 family)